MTVHRGGARCPDVDPTVRTKHTNDPKLVTCERCKGTN